MKKRVAILYGGRSVEHEISIRSARNVVNHIHPDFEVLLVGITKSGDWHLVESLDQEIAMGLPLGLFLSATSPVFVIEGSKSVSVDVIFPVLHGTDGEDGSVQGLFQSMGLPVVGSSVLGSAVAMDKIISKRLMVEAGIPVAPYLTFGTASVPSFADLSSKLGLPFMIKTGNLGSSVGISRVDAKEEYDKALAEGFRFAQELIAEAFVEGRELECGVIGNEEVRTTLPGEIALNDRYKFYTYEAKYLDEKAIEMVIPAKVELSVQQEIRNLSERAYKALGCNDYARVDLFVTADNAILINEINTIPGFTSASMFPSLWKNMGLSYTDLITELISLALKRWEQEKSLERNYFNS